MIANKREYPSLPESNLLKFYQIYRERSISTVPNKYNMRGSPPEFSLKIGLKPDVHVHQYKQGTERVCYRVVEGAEGEDSRCYQSRYTGRRNWEC